MEVGSAGVDRDFYHGGTEYTEKARRTVLVENPVTERVIHVGADELMRRNGIQRVINGYDSSPCDLRVLRGSVVK